MTDDDLDELLESSDCLEDTFEALLNACDTREEHAMPEERMLKWFAYEHLPEKLQAVSKPFGNLATLITTVVEPGPERTVALRKLLEAKDAAVRAVVTPGG